jgi:hypothetical protein
VLTELDQFSVLLGLWVSLRRHDSLLWAQNRFDSDPLRLGLEHGRVSEALRLLRSDGPLFHELLACDFLNCH